MTTDRGTVVSRFAVIRLTAEQLADEQYWHGQRKGDGGRNRNAFAHMLPIDTDTTPKTETPPVPLAYAG